MSAAVYSIDCPLSFLRQQRRRRPRRPHHLAGYLYSIPLLFVLATSGRRSLSLSLSLSVLCFSV